MNKNYTTYQIIDFAEDSFFIKWVKTENLQAKRFWENFLKKHPEKADDIAVAKQLVAAIKVKETEPSDAAVADLWTKIDQSIAALPADQTTAKRVPMRRWFMYAAAAVSIGFFALFFLRGSDELMPTKPGMAATNNAEQIIHTLPDGSEVHLNAASSITFDENNWNNQRTVKLTGEAFFEVEKGSTFTVETQQGKVEVLGTSFNINAYASRFEVACFTGKVKVSTTSGSQILTKGLQTQLENNTLISPIAFDASKDATWKDGQFSFKKARLGEVLAAIERQFDVQIEVAEANKSRSGDFYFENNELEEALRQVLFPFDLKATVNRDKVVIE